MAKMAAVNMVISWYLVLWYNMTIIDSIFKNIKNECHFRKKFLKRSYFSKVIVKTNGSIGSISNVSSELVFMFFDSGGQGEWGQLQS